jgi:flagellar basal body P-ring protein FlgI
MVRRSSRSRAAGLVVAASLGGVAMLAGGCPNKVDAPKAAPPRYADLPADTTLAPVFRGTVKDHTVVANNTPRNVSGYGLVGQLRGTGDTTAPGTIRNFMIKEMVRRGFGDANLPGYRDLNARDVLLDPNYAIVRVDAFIPPGARKEEFIDAYVSCMENNYTKSLVHGTLFETNLYFGGAESDNPAALIHTEGRTKGAIMVNPVYALQNPEEASGPAKASLRNGVIPFNTRVMIDRPLMLRLRKPQGSLARTIAEVVRYRFQNSGEGESVAKAVDDGIVELYVPRSFRGDWERFIKLVQNFYLRADPETDTRMCQELAAQFTQPDAPVEDISYALEGIGQRSLPHLQPLLNHPDPAVSFWASRAAAFIGDHTTAAVTRLAQIARTTNHPYRLQAIRALGNLPNSAAVNHLVGPLLDADEVLVRIEAYRVLAKNRAFPDLPIAPSSNPDNQKFMLDVLPSKAPPLIYVTRTGKPRIAIIGQIPKVRLDFPTFAMDNRFTVAATAGNPQLATLFFRDPQRPAPVRLVTRPSLDIVIARLAGMGPEDEDSLNFNYGEVVALVQSMVDGNRLLAKDSAGNNVPVTMVIQDPPRLEAELLRGGAIAAGQQVGDPQFAPPPGVAPVSSQDVPQFGTPVAPQTPATPGTPASPGGQQAPVAPANTGVPQFGPPAAPPADTGVPQFGPPASGTGGGSNVPQFGPATGAPR